MLNKHSPVIIVGGGAFGLSTALHLSLAGYSDITVFERDEKIPSKYSAAYDINKIVRAEYEDEFYTQLALVRLIPCFPAPLNAHFTKLRTLAISRGQQLTRKQTGRHRSLEKQPHLQPLLPPNRLHSRNLRFCTFKSPRHAPKISVFTYQPPRLPKRN